MKELLGWTLFFVALYLAYLFGLSALTWFGHGGERTRASRIAFFLAGRDLKVFRATMTLWATFFSVGALVGGMGYYYSHGIGTFVFAASSYVIGGAIVFVLGPVIWRRSREDGADDSPLHLLVAPLRSSAVDFSVLVVTLLFLIPYMTMQVAGMAKLLGSTFGAPYLLSAVGTLGVVYLYSEIGGLRNVAKTDAVQGTVMFGALALSAYFFVSNYWDGLFELFAAVREDSPALLDPFGGPAGFFTPGVVFSLAWMFAVAVLTQPQMAKRMIIPARESTSRTMGPAFAVLGVLLIGCVGILALGGALRHPGLKSGDAVVGAILLDLPAPLGALIVLGMLAATMSTADSLLLAFGQIVSEQLSRGPQGKRRLTDSQSISASGGFSFIIVVLAFAAGLQPPRLIADLAVMSFGGSLQLLPVIVVGLLKVRLPPGFGVASIWLGVATLAWLQWFAARSWSLGLHPAMLGMIVGAVVAAVGLLVASLRGQRD